MNRLRILFAIAAFSALAACGRMGELEPAPGQSLPVKPRMAQATPTAEELLTPPPYADPKRVDEIMKKSTPRKVDPFNLPPPGGQAPTAPVQELNANSTSNQAGPITPNGQ
jgi:predicted small lipoprotein YifL